MGKLDGRVALITGGARGQGRSHARTLAAEGADIVIGDACVTFPHVPYSGSTEADLQETAKLVEELDRRCLIRQTDVTRADQTRGLVEAAISEFGKIDILVINHGIFAGGVPTWELEEAARQRPRLTWMARPARACWARCRYRVGRLMPLARSSSAMSAPCSCAMHRANQSASSGVVVW